MRDDEKIFDAFRRAAANVEENPDFPAMGKVWERVGDKLDRRELKSGMARWKKLAIAASLLLIGTIGYLLLSDKEQVENRVVISEPEIQEKPEIQVLPLPEKPDSTRQIIILEPQRAVATAEPSAQVISEVPFISPAVTQAADKVFTPAPKAEADIVAGVDPQQEVEMVVAEPKSAQPAKSSAPLLVVDGKAMTGKEYTSRKKVSAASDDEVETVVLDEPLYVINGVHYSEEEMYGPNPTSPYAPLNKQEIESVEVLQGKEAIAAYGEKGRKGVLIIKTKNGKPASPQKAKSR